MSNFTNILEYLSLIPMDAVLSHGMWESVEHMAYKVIVKNEVPKKDVKLRSTGKSVSDSLAHGEASLISEMQRTGDLVSELTTKNKQLIAMLEAVGVEVDPSLRHDGGKPPDAKKAAALLEKVQKLAGGQAPGSAPPAPPKPAGSATRGPPAPPPANVVNGALVTISNKGRLVPSS